MRPPPLKQNTAFYERPNQPWVCGLAVEGHACAAGPTVRGACPALAECAPIRDGDRWLCNRAPVRGGPCELGPAPEGACGCVPHCSPVSSLRTKRSRFVFACALTTAATLVLMLSADWRNEVIAPGPLASQHAQLLRREGAPPQCDACHAAAKNGPVVWTTSLVTGHRNEPSQSQLCMKCHARTIGEQFALQAHNVSPELLQPVRRGDKETRRQGELTALSASLSPPLLVSPSSTNVACAICHREHHGANFDLTAMDNDACQACHQQRYESFATDHPDFGRWPYTRRTPIAFNHASHVAKHFPEKHQAFDCRKCHIEDHTQDVQLLTNYETACASCHNEKIATSVAHGVPMFVLPTFDVEALRDAGHDIGPWPKEATGDFDGRLPPAMKLLLSADPAANQAMTKLRVDFEFSDIDADDKDQLSASSELAAAIKKLLVELKETGIASARTRLSKALGREISEQEFRELFAGLSSDTLQPASRAWLGEIASEKSPSQTSDVLHSAPGTWFYDEATMSIRYWPTGHADAVLASWLTQITSASAADQSPLTLAMLKELSKPTAPGLCASCHSVEKSDADQLTIHWRANDHSAAPRPFTKFAHGPHLLLRDLADCTACHALNNTADTSKAYANWSPHEYASEFQPLAKQTCAACHTAKAAGDSCQKCHNYHVEASGPPARALLSTLPFVRVQLSDWQSSRLPLR